MCYESTMRLETLPQNTDRLAGLIAVELHVDEPLLPHIVRNALRDFRGGFADPVTIGPALADNIEDTLAYEGRPLSRHLNEKALADWRGIVRRAFTKALGRTVSAKASR